MTENQQTKIMISNFYILIYLPAYLPRAFTATLNCMINWLNIALECLKFCMPDLVFNKLIILHLLLLNEAQFFNI